MTVQTHPQDNRDLRLAVRQGLLPARGTGWLTGFSNMLRKELGEWFRTRRWLWQVLIWVILINGFLTFPLFIMPRLESLLPGVSASLEQPYIGLPPGSMGLSFFFTISLLAGTVGVIILAQDEIIQEKQSGTAAWILSKPAARPAFILTKWLSNVIGALVFLVTLPALVALGEIYLKIHQMVPLVPFLAGVGSFLLTLIFYIGLVILVGVLSESRGPVIGVAFGIMLGGMLLSNFIPYIAYILPVTMDKVAQVLLMGMPLPAMMVSQLISTAVLSIIFILVALWRFQHREF
jgi:ABC-2 type transport system permease protein